MTESGPLVGFLQAYYSLSTPISDPTSAGNDADWSQLSHYASTTSTKTITDFFQSPGRLQSRRKKQTSSYSVFEGKFVQELLPTREDSIAESRAQLISMLIPHGHPSTQLGSQDFPVAGVAPEDSDLHPLWPSDLSAKYLGVERPWLPKGFITERDMTDFIVQRPSLFGEVDRLVKLPLYMPYRWGESTHRAGAATYSQYRHAYLWSWATEPPRMFQWLMCCSPFCCHTRPLLPVPHAVINEEGFARWLEEGDESVWEEHDKTRGTFGSCWSRCSSRARELKQRRIRSLDPGVPCVYDDECVYGEFRSKSVTPPPKQSSPGTVNYDISYSGLRPLSKTTRSAAWKELANTAHHLTRWVKAFAKEEQGAHARKKANKGKGEDKNKARNKDDKTSGNDDDDVDEKHERLVEDAVAVAGAVKPRGPDLRHTSSVSTFPSTSTSTSASTSTSSQPREYTWRNSRVLYPVSGRQGICTPHWVCRSCCSRLCTCGSPCKRMFTHPDHVFAIVAGLQNSDENPVVWSYIMESFETLMYLPSFLNLPGYALRAILSAADLAANEFLVYQSVIRWARFRIHKRGEDHTNALLVRAEMNELIPHIRFPLMTAEELVYVARTPILTQEELLNAWMCKCIYESGGGVSRVGIVYFLLVLI